MKSVRINIGGTWYTLTPYNCALFFFNSENEQYNHLYVVTDEDTDSGLYVFGEPQAYKMLAESRVVTMHYLPQDEVPDQDRRAYEMYLKKQAAKESAINTTSEELSEQRPLTAEEVEAIAQQFRNERIHWDELDGGGEK
jgi:hypothetical protein